MELILDDDDHIQFYPAIEDLENAIVKAAAVILDTLQNIPTVQVTKIFYLLLLYYQNYVW